MAETVMWSQPTRLASYEYIRTMLYLSTHLVDEQLSLFAS